MARVGPGWHELVRRAWGFVVERDGGRVVDAREKFGELRIYHEDTLFPEETDRRIRDGFGRASLQTCEGCGAYGTLRTDDEIWKTLCDRCAHRFYVLGFGPDWDRVRGDESAEEG
jgi:hypothetical protein